MPKALSHALLPENKDSLLTTVQHNRSDLSYASGTPSRRERASSVDRTSNNLALVLACPVDAYEKGVSKHRARLSVCARPALRVALEICFRVAVEFCGADATPVIDRGSVTRARKHAVAVTHGQSKTFRANVTRRAERHIEREKTLRAQSAHWSVTRRTLVTVPVDAIGEDVTGWI